MTTAASKQKVLIVGGGFGGIKAALELADHSSQQYDITLVSDQPNFRYYPALYRTATGGTPANSSIPLARLFKDKPVTLHQGTAVKLDRLTKSLELKDGGSIPFDILILGLGVVTNYFGIPGMQEYSYSIKSHDEIARLKEHLHQQLADERKPDLNYVIVGAGPTGIELAGALPEYLDRIMTYHEVKRRAIHIDLVESNNRLLPRMPKDTSAMVTRRLKKLGVKLYTKKAVQGVAADQLTVSGKPIRSHTVIWTAGVTNHPFFKENGFMMTPRGKVVIDMYLQAEENIYVIGDNANTPYSGMAQTALLDGIYVAENLKRRAEGEDPKGYKVKKPITVIPVGDFWASVVWGKLRLYGWPAWTMREAADLLAFADYEPWWKAGKQWLTGFQEEETCDTCLRAMRREYIDK
ncbi:MAG TPA: NAD(P)/FAD-dependent oxidoreductase [Candidatus Saccharimonadales bacterium]|jgi:NADH dehydrogenase